MNAAPPLTAAAAKAVPRVSHGLAAFALALLLGLQPVTTDIYLPALPMLTRELGRADERGAADDVGADPGLRPGAAVLGPGGRPRGPPAGAAHGAGAVHRGQHRQRAGRQHRLAGGVARAAGRGHGRRRGLRARHRARPVRTARRRAGDVAGAVGAGRDRDRRPGAGRHGRGGLGLARRARRRGRLRCADAGLHHLAAARDAAAQEPQRHARRPAAGPVVADRPPPAPSSPGRCWCPAPTAGCSRSWPARPSSTSTCWA